MYIHCADAIIRARSLKQKPVQCTVHVQYCVQYSIVQPRHLVHGLEDVEDGLLLPQVGQHQRNLELGEVVLLSGRRRGVM